MCRAFDSVSDGRITNASRVCFNKNTNRNNHNHNPLLFLLYINGIIKASAKLKFFLFADDTNLLYANKDLKI